ncbi:MAG TPA: lactonase family protein [Stellaceae bacterium]|nr:lactonase family protein [Stellaceae bacterium]
MFAYVGCYTTRERQARGEGINVYRVDPASGLWRHVQLVPELVNPSFLAVGSGGRRLYAVHGDEDDVTAFAIGGEDGRPTLLNRQKLGGRNGVHLSVDPENRFLVTANYANGTVSVVPLEADGALGRRVATLALPGEPGPHRVQQTGSRPHSIPFDPSGRFVLVPDKGLDRVFIFRLDEREGRLVPNDPPFVMARPGAAPRHMAFHPAAPYAYVNNELDSTVTAYHWDEERGRLEPFQIVPSLPDTYTGANTTAEIAVDPIGRFLYVSNRGHDSIGIFAIEQTNGRLAPVGWESTRGRRPRFFALDPAGRFLYAANEASDTIVTFRVDPQSGRLDPTGEIIETASPACIVFAGS